MTTTPLIERLRTLLASIQGGDRPLPWVVHSSCSYRRIASQPTRENLRTFPDGNVLHAYNQRSDNHPDLSMGEQQLEALVDLINSMPEMADELARLTALVEEMKGALEKIGSVSQCLCARCTIMGRIARQTLRLLPGTRHEG